MGSKESRERNINESRFSSFLKGKSSEELCDLLINLDDEVKYSDLYPQAQFKKRVQRLFGIPFANPGELAFYRNTVENEVISAAESDERIKAVLERRSSSELLSNLPSMYSHFGEIRQKAEALKEPFRESLAYIWEAAQVYKISMNG